MTVEKPRRVKSISERSKWLPSGVNFCTPFMPVEVNLSTSSSFHMHEEEEI